MTTKYVALLRAINVAGHATIGMADLKATFTAAGCQRVRSYIQSGNVIFEVPDPELKSLQQRIGNQLNLSVGH